MPAATFRTPATPPSSSGRRRAALRPAIIAAASAVLALAVRFVGIGRANLWLDEANSWFVATYPLATVTGHLQEIPGAAAHLPLFFILLKGWMQAFGDSEAALRALSVVASAALVLVTYAIGARLLRRRAALLGALLMAASPLQLYFAQEARMYMFVALLCACCALAYLAWWDAPDRGPAAGARLAAYVLFAVLALYTHLGAGLLLVALNADALVRLLERSGRRALRDRRLAPWVLAQLAVGAAFLPYLLGIDREAATASQGWRHPLGFRGAAEELVRFPLQLAHGIYAYQPQFGRIWRDFAGALRWGPEARKLLEVAIFYPLTLLAVTIALAYPPRAGAPGAGGEAAGGARGVSGAGGDPVAAGGVRTRAARRFLYLTLLLPLAAGVVVAARQELQFARYFLFATPFLALLIGAGLDRLPRAVSGPTLAALLLACLLGTLGTWRVHTRDSDYRGAAALLEERVAAGDTVFAIPADNEVSLLYYLRDTGIESRSLDSVEELLRVLRLQAHRRWVVLDYRSRLFDASPAELRSMLRAEPAVQRRFGGGSTGVLVVALDPRGPGESAREVRTGREIRPGNRASSR